MKLEIKQISEMADNLDRKRDAILLRMCDPSVAGFAVSRMADQGHHITAAAELLRTAARRLDQSQ